jgi:acid phosphatase (class A)
MLTCDAANIEIFYFVNMARFRIVPVILVLALAFAFAFAKDVKPYVDIDKMPDALVYYPPPPETTSVQFAYDVAQYKWGKSMRADSARAALAVAQAVESVEEMAKLFSGPFGMEISAKNTPAIMNVLERTVKTIRTGKFKNHYMRRRPFDRFNEPTLIPEHEEKLRKNGSYPSGHTTRAWIFAMLLVEINPDAADALLKYAYEWGQSRVIAGFHWQSDVDASKVIVSAGFARIHGEPEFLADMQKAKAEFKKLKAKK